MRPGFIIHRLDIIIGCSQKNFTIFSQDRNVLGFSPRICYGIMLSDLG
jgi:hypothetical protein